MRPLDEQGLTLVELMIVMALSLVVLSATLATFTKLVRGAHDRRAR
jgi:prepilin-type N-terminal cleavage/methylation domain-containing protein